MLMSNELIKLLDSIKSVTQGNSFLVKCRPVVHIIWHRLYRELHYTSIYNVYEMTLYQQLRFII